MENKGILIRNYYIMGTLVTKSPLKMSSGNDEYSGNDLQRDWHNIPFIPGTSIAGVLKEELIDHIKDAGVYFGTGDDDNKISNVITYDAYPVDGFKISIRDGVCIDNQFKTGIDKMKHDYEVIETGTEFAFRMEIRQYEEEQDISKIIEAIMIILAQSFILGSKGTRGFGKVFVKPLYYLDLDIKNDIDRFINFKWDESAFNKYESSNINKTKINKLEISLDLEIDTSLIIREYYKGDDDTVSMTSNNKYVIPGTSFAGIFRHGMYDILLELSGETKAEEITNELFGYIDENNKIAKKSRIYVEEAIIEETQPLKIVRNRIDRFTGGTIETALFDSKPVFGGKFTLNLTIDKPSSAEEALIYMVLHDLSNGLISIGGEKAIGRGNVSLLNIRINGEEIDFNKFPNNEQYKSLQNMIDGGKQ